MKFSLLMVPQCLKGQPEPFDNMLEQIELADELGYDGAWLTEHHFSEYGRSAVPALAGNAIARTKNIRIGTAIAVLPFHHPLRIAEDWATLDHLAKGRIDFGIGRGNQPHEFHGFGVPMEDARERFNESLDIIRTAWTQETFSYEGKYWQIPELELVPKPFQDPHPPLYQAAVSAYTVKMIIENGINGLIGPYLCPFDVLKREFFDVWHDAIEESGRTDLEMIHNEFVYVGESEEEIKRDVKDAVMWYVRKAARIWGERDRSKVAGQYSNYNEVLEWLEVVSWDEVYESLSIIGTPDQVAEKMRWMRDEGRCDNIMNFMSFGGLSQDKVLRSMKLFAEEVMPQLADDKVPAGA